MGFNVWYWHYNEEEILMKPVDIHIIGTKYGIPILFGGNASVEMKRPLVLTSSKENLASVSDNPF